MEGKNFIYLDNSATSLYKPLQVKLAVMDALNNLTANPGRSGHCLSQMVAAKIFGVREKVKELFNADNYNVIFTKNCTEALNVAIFGVLKPGDEVITTVYEHNSVLRPLETLKKQGVKVVVLDCELSEFAKDVLSKITVNTKLVITTAVSNVVGEICDIYKVGAICREHNIMYLIDAAQGAGHLQIDMQKCGATMLAFAGHKGLLATTGVGGLVIKQGTILNPILMGGTGTNSDSLIQPKEIPEGLESGTVPTIPIISLGAGVDYVLKQNNSIIEKEKELSLYTYSRLKQLDFIRLYSSVNSLNVFSFNIRDLDSSFVANQLNENFNICVRAGLHCAPLIHKKFNTLKQGMVRVSLDFNNTHKDIDNLIFALKYINKEFV